MPTESSAIAEIVNLAHARGIEEAPEPVSSLESPPPKQHSLLWFLLAAIVVIGGSIIGGYLLAQYDSSSIEADASSAEVVSKEVPVEEEQAPKEEEAIATLLDAGPAVDLELAKKTGFDVFVKPSGGNVSLNGQLLGVAPLRVRNLLPGPHAIDIEGPPGFFGKHLDSQLNAGESKVLDLVLEPLGELSKEGEEASIDREERKRSTKEVVEAPDNPKPRKRSRNKTTPNEDKAMSEKVDKVLLGTLMLGSKPPCQITINGKKTGLTTPQRVIQLPEGMHQVVLTNAEHNIRKSFKVKIKAGRTTKAIIKDLL